MKNSSQLDAILAVFLRGSTSTRNLTGVVARGESSIDLLACKTNDSRLSIINARDRGQVPIDLLAVGGALLGVSNRNASTGSLRFSMCFAGRGQFVLCCRLLKTSSFPFVELSVTAAKHATAATASEPNSPVTTRNTTQQPTNSFTNKTFKQI